MFRDRLFKKSDFVKRFFIIQLCFNMNIIVFIYVTKNTILGK